MELGNKKNPYAKADGMPKKGKLLLFWKWIEREAIKKFDAMSPDDQKKQIAANEHMQRKMNS